MNSKVIVARHAAATDGSRTRDGGIVRITFQADERMGINNVPFASVGDEVIYPDGRVALIDSGAGFAATWRDRPLALVGSSIDNGDIIVDTLFPDGLIIDEIEGETIPGLFEKGYRLPPSKDE